MSLTLLAFCVYFALMKNIAIITCIAFFSFASCGESNQETAQPVEALVFDTTATTQETVAPTASVTATATTTAVATPTAQ